jgi:hypothetical protein
MFDAWNNGGLVDGKAVTDSRLLSYIKGRRDGFSQDDPLWDEWNNRLTQYDFSIGESKIQLAFRQGKASAGAVAAFYRNKLKGIPKDSEFYRDVAERAAQWAGSVGRAARGSGRAKAKAAIRDKLNASIRKGFEFEALQKALTDYARREGIITGSQELTEGSALSLRNMFEAGLTWNDEPLTFEVYQSMAKDQHGRLDDQFKYQLQLGNQGIEARNRRDRFMDEVLVGLNTIDERGQYELAYKTWNEDVAAANGDPYAIAQANAKYAARLEGVYRNIDPDDDPLVQGAILNEVKVLNGEAPTGVSVAEMFGVNDDLAGTAEAVARTQQDMKDLESGKAYYGQTEPGGPLGVVAWAPGTSNNPLGLDKSLQPSVQTIGGQPRVVYLKGQEVTASIIKDANDKPVVPTAENADVIRAGLANGTYSIDDASTLGYVFVNPVTGKKKYGVIDAMGQMRFADYNPWSDGELTTNGTGLTVFATDVRPDGKVNPQSLLRFPDQTINLDPVLMDSPIAPQDLANIVGSGLPGFALGEQQLAEYQQKLQRQYQQEQTRRQGRDLGVTDIAGVGVSRDLGISDPRDVRSSLINGMDAVRNATQKVFGSPDRTKDDIYVPPAPPKPELVAAPIPESNVGKATDSSSFDAKLKDPYYQFKTKPDKPSAGGAAGAGSYGALNKWKDDQLEQGAGIGSGTGGR